MYKIGDTCYFLESNIYALEGIIRSSSGGKYVIQYRNGKGIRLPESRLYRTKEDAEAAAPRKATVHRKKTPYDFM